tara:strand:- start:203 stop:796 length:594 start_codon:yes stop_codon:yes gene_type:complete
LDSFDTPQAALISIILADLALAGDNAMLVGMIAKSMPKEFRNKTIFYGIMGAVIFRIIFALFAFKLMQIPELLIVGGIFLLWIAWGLARHGLGSSPLKEKLISSKPKSVRTAIIQLILADLAMSFDNVIAVAGAAHNYLWIMIFGLALSVALMIVASKFIANFLERYPRMIWIGIITICYIAIVPMIIEGIKNSYLL